MRAGSIGEPRPLINVTVPVATWLAEGHAERPRNMIVKSLRAFIDPGSDAATTGRAALVAVARLYAEHGQLIRALQESADEDPEAARIWREFTEPPERANGAVFAEVRLPPNVDVTGPPDGREPKAERRGAGPG